MSASGPKQTSSTALHMSAFGGKADMTFCESPLSRSLLGVKRTWLVAAHMSAFDPKRTSQAVRRPVRCSAKQCSAIENLALRSDLLEYPHRRGFDIKEK